MSLSKDLWSTLRGALRTDQPSKPSIPYCTAPFTSVCVNPDKGVRPCCDFIGTLGNIEETPLTDILGGAQWNTVKGQISRGETPPGCVGCLEREKATGWSVRKTQFDARATGDESWRNGLTQLEIDSSNLCNLACTHCSSNFSSQWTKLNRKLGKAVQYHHGGWQVKEESQAPNPENMLRQIAALDLNHLEVVRFKGGEPMMNRDVPAVLRHLLERGVLQNVSADFVSNGSVINKRVLELLRHARSVVMCLSVDGMGPLQRYIRRGPSDIARIEAFLDAFAALEKIEFTLNVSVMAYNVFSLDLISEWWGAMSRRHPGKVRPLGYGLAVVDPPMLFVNVLQDGTRERLIQKYSHASGADYSCVIESLKLPFGGPLLHNEFVSYTRDMDRIWSSNVLDVVPELAPEMVLLHVPAEDSRDAVLEAGMALGRAGSHEQALERYDRFLDTHGKRSDAWEIRLHRAIVLGKVEKWEASLGELRGLVSRSPGTTLEALDRARMAGKSSFPAQLSDAYDAGFALTPSFALVMEALAYGALDDLPRAAARLDKALELDPGFALAKVAKKAMGVVA